MKKFYLLLCAIAMSSMASFAQEAYYELPDGAFVGGMTETAVVVTPSVYLPYSPDGHVWKATSTGDWTVNSKSAATGTATLTQTYSPGYKYYVPEFNNGESYKFGNDNSYVYGGTATMAYLTPAKAYDPIMGTSSSIVNLGWPTDTYSDFRMFFPNNDVMYIDKIIIPVTGLSSKYPTKAQMFPDGCTMTLSVYSAEITKNDDGSYDRTQGSLLFSKALTPADYNQSSKEYQGGIVADFTDEPKIITGSYVMVLNTTGCHFYPYAVKQKVKTKLSQMAASGATSWSQTNSTSTNYVLAFTVHAMFPALYKDDASQEELNVMAGGSTKVAIHSNVDPAQFTIECPEWITYDISYEDAGGFKATALSYITFTSSNTSVTEPGTITINNRGKEISYTINQTSSIFEKGDNVETIRFVPSKTDNKTVAITTNLAPEAVAVTNTASEWLDYELTAVEGGLSLNLTTKGAATVSRKGVVTLTADNKTVSYDVRQDVVNLVIGDAKWATYAGPYTFTPKDENLVVKNVAYTDGKLEYTDAASITAFVPVVLFSETAVNETRNFTTSTYNYVFEDSYTLGPLVGVLADTAVTPASTDSYNYYFLQNLDGVVAWYLGQEDITYTVTANHCYLKIEKSAGAPVRAFYFDTPTGIDALTTQLATGKNVRTNLAGQVVNDSYKGIVIENGKKFIKK